MIVALAAVAYFAAALALAVIIGRAIALANRKQTHTPDAKRVTDRFEEWT